MHIHALNLYPVKSLAGISLPRALLTAKGLATPCHDGLLYDRQWMLINAAGQMVTQRQLPELALVQPV
ncbi:MAG TPA: MOSC N-terminal beta barrel domain-containing protein, partial [Cellvibrionaceae bacterium]|nr:MOSC N-terminal beta barrel domain-containing protein [Cellvibrionaceae bacterium]